MSFSISQVKLIFALWLLAQCMLPIAHVMYLLFFDQSQDPVIHIQGQQAENSGAANGSWNSGVSFEGDGSSSDSDSVSDSDDLGRNYRGSFRLSTVERQVQILGAEIGTERAMHSYKLSEGMWAGKIWVTL